MKRLAKQICSLQDELRGRVSVDAWSHYLELEAVASERLAKAVELVASIGFKLGKDDRP